MSMKALKTPKTLAAQMTFRTVIITGIMKDIVTSMMIMTIITIMTILMVTISTISIISVSSIDLVCRLFVDRAAVMDRRCDAWQYYIYIYI